MFISESTPILHYKITFDIIGAGLKLCCSIVVARDEDRGRCILDACCPFGERLG